VIARFGLAALLAVCSMLAFVPDRAHSQDQPQVNRDIRSYLLFAAADVHAEGGHLTGGNIGANGVGINLNNTAAVRICASNDPDAFMSDGTQMVGDSVRFVSRCHVYNAFYNRTVGGSGGVARNFQGPFTPPVISPMPPFPDFACDPTAPDLTVSTHQTATVRPGSYDQVTFQDGTHVRMEAGVYEACRFHTGRDLAVTTEPGVIMRVQEQWRLGPDSSFSGPGCEGIPRVVVRGTGIGHNDDSIDFSNESTAWGHFYAASHGIALGPRNDLHGTFWAANEGTIPGYITSGAGTDVDYCPPVGTSDLSIRKVRSRRNVPAGGGQVMYALVVRNHGADDDPDVRVTDPMAEGLTLDSARASQGSPCSTDNNTVSCHLGELRAGGAAVVLVTATTTDTPGCITNTARVEGDNPDPRPANNDDSARVCVLSPEEPEPPGPEPPGPEPPQPPEPPGEQFNLRVTKTADDHSVVVGEPVRYRVVVTNEGPAPAPDVILQDALNAPVSVVDVRTTQGSCGPQGPIVQCRLGRIGAGESVTITAVVRHREAGAAGQRNAAGAIGNGHDSRPRNNLARTAVRVRPHTRRRAAPPVTG
jgi:uncharacterized repeat protein (TIGR01451 family)